MSKLKNFFRSKVGTLVAVLLIIVALAFVGKAYAADKALGGDCCADLEERIAELESTVARKGNRKMTLTVYGQINKTLLHWRAEGGSDTVVTENSAAESGIGFRGEARISPDTKAGYVLEIGVGGYDDSLFNGIGYGPLFGGDTNGIYTRRSYLYIENAKVGKLSVGLASQASDDITAITTANTDAAVRMLSLRPFVGPTLGEALDIFDGARTDLVRYDSPVFEGFMLSASWSNADLTSDGSVWDVALRYAKDWGQFRVAAGAAYRHGLVVPQIGATEDVIVYAGSASIMHMPTGLFITGAAGRFEGDGVLTFLPQIDGWQFQAGVEEKWMPVGKTTVFGEFGELKIDGYSGTPRVIGLGVVQNFESAALDVYVDWRRYTFDTGSDDELDAFMGGARVRF
jgi:hypothetical protein